MNCVFKKVILERFLSFGNAEIDLQNKSYCLIRGVNNCKDDMAKSNGAGKSSIANAICWCLNGETLTGVRNGIENNFLEGGCSVKLFLTVDGDDYEITRYRNHEVMKSDLKIIKNGEDISGKGLRESENILKDTLPNLNKELLSSVILLGQGLPSSFTKNTPSERKQLLEILTNTDCMYVDVKNRIDNRLQNLTSNKRNYEDDKLSTESKKSILEENLSQLRQRLLNFTDNSVLLQQVEAYKASLVDLNNQLINLQSQVAIDRETLNTLNEQYVNLSKEKMAELNDIESKYQTAKEGIQTKLTACKTRLEGYYAELSRIKNIKDVCPTCGQKIPGVIKPDTSKLDEDIVKDNGQQINLQEQLNSLTSRKTTQVSKVQEKYLENETKFSSQLVAIKEKVKQEDSTIYNLNEQIKTLTTNLARDEQLLANSEQQKKELNNNIQLYEQTLIDYENCLLKDSQELDYIQQHIDMVNKINTLVKRDFRGYLLLDIISFLDAQAKEYCKYLFNTDDLKIELNGTNIDISFKGKPFDNLSGGEKKKIDCIIQFAIRNLLSKYFNFTSNILFLDELFDELDTVGCDGLLNLISETLNDIESVFIISHHGDELGLSVDNEMVVVKNDNGISEVEVC